MTCSCEPFSSKAALSGHGVCLAGTGHLPRVRSDAAVVRLLHLPAIRDGLTEDAVLVAQPVPDRQRTPCSPATRGSRPPAGPARRSPASASSSISDSPSQPRLEIARRATCSARMFMTLLRSVRPSRYSIERYETYLGRSRWRARRVSTQRWAIRSLMKRAVASKRWRGFALTGSSQLLAEQVALDPLVLAPGEAEPLQTSLDVGVGRGSVWCVEAMPNPARPRRE